MPTTQGEPRRLAPARLRLASVSKTLLVSAGIAALAIYLLLWLPVFLTGSEASLFLWPVAALVWVPIELTFVASITTGIAASRPRPWRVVAGAFALALLGPIVTWFGFFLPLGPG